MTATTTGASLDHDIGPTGLLSIRLGDGRARLRAVDGDLLRVRDGHGATSPTCSRSSWARAAPRSRPTSARTAAGRGRSHTPDVEVDIPRRCDRRDRRRAAPTSRQTGSPATSATGPRRAT